MDTGFFRRVGAEMAGDDRRAGNATPVTRTVLAELLAAHRDDDLALLAEHDRAEAVAAMVEGYLHGG